MNMKERIQSMSQMSTALTATVVKADLSDSEAYTASYFYPEWEPNQSYDAQTVFRYEGELYRVAQNTTSSETYLPGAPGTESIYTHISVDPEGYEEWQQPTGAHDAYAKDKIVKDPTDGKLYKSKVNGNVWGPPSTMLDYWEIYQES